MSAREIFIAQSREDDFDEYQQEVKKVAREKIKAILEYRSADDQSVYNELEIQNLVEEYGERGQAIIDYLNTRSDADQYYVCLRPQDIEELSVTVGDSITSKILDEDKIYETANTKQWVSGDYSLPELDESVGQLASEEDEECEDWYWHVPGGRYLDLEDFVEYMENKMKEEGVE